MAATAVGACALVLTFLPSFLLEVPLGLAAVGLGVAGHLRSAGGRATHGLATAGAVMGTVALVLPLLPFLGLLLGVRTVSLPALSVFLPV